jgi:uncharacterized protein YjiK
MSRTIVETWGSAHVWRRSYSGTWLMKIFVSMIAAVAMVVVTVFSTEVAIVVWYWNWIKLSDWKGNRILIYFTAHRPATFQLALVKIDVLSKP